MNKIKIACLATLLSSGIAFASPACDGFEIKVKNDLADKLVVTSVKLNGAELNPAGIQALDSKSEQVFTVNKSPDNDEATMKGRLVFHTLSFPVKKIKIFFDLENAGLVCKHTERSPESDYSVDKTRLPGKVEYLIHG